MGFRNATSCSCCAQEPCACYCPDIDAALDLIIDIPNFGPGAGIACGMCEDLDGLFSLAYGQPFFTPRIAYLPGLGCYYQYLGDLRGSYYCGDYEPIYFNQQMIEARTFCAYEKDGHIYDDTQAKPDGAKLIGRAIEVMYTLAVFWNQIYWPLSEYCYTVNTAYPLTRQEACEMSLYGAVGIGSVIGNYCCGYDPYDPNFIPTINNIDPSLTTIYNCDYPSPFCNQNIGAGEGMGADVCVGGAFGCWLWRTIISQKANCWKSPLSLSLVTDEEELSRRYISSWRNRRDLSETVCKVISPLCDAPNVITVEKG